MASLLRGIDVIDVILIVGLSVACFIAAGVTLLVEFDFLPVTYGLP